MNGQNNPLVLVADDEDHFRRSQVEALKFFGAAANLGKHVTVNTQIDVDGTTATGVSDFLFLDKENKPSTVGRYEDRFRKEGDAWKFTQRRILFAGS